MNWRSAKRKSPSCIPKSTRPIARCWKNAGRWKKRRRSWANAWRRCRKPSRRLYAWPATSSPGSRFICNCLINSRNWKSLGRAPSAMCELSTRRLLSLGWWSRRKRWSCWAALFLAWCCRSSAYCCARCLTAVSKARRCWKSTASTSTPAFRSPNGKNRAIAWKASTAWSATSRASCWRWVTRPTWRSKPSAACAPACTSPWCKHRITC